MPKELESITSEVWGESSLRGHPYVADKCLLAGYDVYGDLLGKVRWIEYLYLLFKHAAPSAEEADMLNHLAVAIACSGQRDHGVQAAMSAAAAGSTLASTLIASLSVGAGQLGGAHEVSHVLTDWKACQLDKQKWLSRIECFAEDRNVEPVWPQLEHPPGFNPLATVCSTPIIQTLEQLSVISFATHTQWLMENRLSLEEKAGMPLAMTGLAGAAFYDLGFDPQQGEMLYLLLRLPGAAALALEQHERGWRDYIFHRDGLDITNDPGEE